VLCLTKHHKIPNSNFKSKKKYEKTILDCVQKHSRQNYEKKKSSNPLLLYISWKVIELILFFNLKWLLLLASVFYSISFNWVLTNNEIEWGAKIVNSVYKYRKRAFQIRIVGFFCAFNVEFCGFSCFRQHHAVCCLIDN